LSLLPTPLAARPDDAELELGVPTSLIEAARWPPCR
jgi:hypothetical protein